MVVRTLEIWVGADLGRVQPVSRRTQGEAARRLRHTCEYERRVRFHLIDGSLAPGREHGASDHRLLPRARAVLCLKF